MALERDAAEIIERRIADGRPPPEVWRAAAQRRAGKGVAADAWYRSPESQAPGQRRPTALSRRPVPSADEDLVLRVVDLPLAPTPSAPTPGRKAGRPTVVADASN